MSRLVRFCIWRAPALVLLPPQLNSEALPPPWCWSRIRAGLKTCFLPTLFTACFDIFSNRFNCFSKLKILPFTIVIDLTALLIQTRGRQESLIILFLFLFFLSFFPFPLVFICFRFFMFFVFWAFPFTFSFFGLFLLFFFLFFLFRAFLFFFALLFPLPFLLFFLPFLLTFP